LNEKIKTVIRNFSYSFSANIVSLFITILSIVIIPKVVGVTEYGYWQIYLFYTSYIGFLYLGHADGVYLKYGGREYDCLDKRLFVSQFWILVSFEIIIALAIAAYAQLFTDNTDKSFILLLLSLNIIIVLPRALLLVILQATNRINEYAKSIMLERVLYGALAIGLVAVGVRDYKNLVLVDLLAKVASFILTIIYCKELVIGKTVSLKPGLIEAYDNIKIGINLMFSNIASRSIIGIVRFGIEKNWDVATFGKVSLTMSVSNMLMLFINAVGVVLYPILRNTSIERLPQIYIRMRNILVLSFLGMLVLYYPAYAILILWLPEYADSLIYMALLFPICVYESKMSMLIIPYFNTLRKEKLMMLINWITLGISIIMSFIIILILNNLFLTVLAITGLLSFRCIISEIVLSRILNIDIKFDIILELLMTIVFIFCAWLVHGFAGALFYMIAYLIYLYFKRTDILEIRKLFLSVVRNKPK
jgi:O-antigen/teichoic acid export membrane protein